MRWVGNAAGMGKTVMDLKGIGWEGMDWIQLNPGKKNTGELL
jgi:hypothetical protein